MQISAQISKSASGSHGLFGLLLLNDLLLSGLLI
jgi:hypothetical protein